MHAEAVSEQHRQALDATFTVLSFVPSPSTGVKVADYLTGVATGNAQSVIAGLDPQIVTDDEISRLTTEPRTVAKQKLQDSIVSELALSPEQQAAIGRDASEIVGSQYDDLANAFANPDSTGAYNIFKPGENENQNTGSAMRGDMS
jgi:hypothetical protein